jgi:predicted secreted protein
VAEHRVSAQQNGARITLRVGDVLVVHLPENATTGHRWAIRSLDEARFVVEADGYYPQHEDPDKLGSGGEAYWKLRARSAGTSRIELINRREWEGDRSIIDRFAIEADVRAGTPPVGARLQTG